MPGEDPQLSFREYLGRIIARSDKTIGAYQADIDCFSGYCRKNRRTLASCLTRQDVAMYLMDRTEARRRREDEPPQLTGRSAARVVSAIRSYCQYLVFTGALSEDPLSGFTPPKYSRRLPPYFNSEELKALVTVYDGLNDPVSLRNSAILHLLYATGLRVSECASLDVSGIRSREDWLTVMGKGRKQRIVPYGAISREAVLKYLKLGRPRLATPESGEALWLNRRGRRLSARLFQTMLREAGEKAGLNKTVTPHKLRHACATHMLEGGAGIRLVQEMLGHESLNTTQVYTQITRTRLRDVYEKAHPRATRPGTGEDSGD